MFLNGENTLTMTPEVGANRDSGSAIGSGRFAGQVMSSVRSGAANVVDDTGAGTHARGPGKC